MNWASFATLLSFLAYTIISLMVLGPQDSLSATFYAWKRENFSSAWNLFSAVVFITVAAQHFYPYKESTKLILMGSAFCMWLLTVASTYKERPLLHYIPTIACILLGFLANYVQFGWEERFWLVLLVFALLVSAIKVSQINYSLLWIELAAVVCIFWNFLRLDF